MWDSSSTFLSSYDLSFLKTAGQLVWTVSFHVGLSGVSSWWVLGYAFLTDPGSSSGPLVPLLVVSTLTIWSVFASSFCGHRVTIFPSWVSNLRHSTLHFLEWSVRRPLGGTEEGRWWAGGGPRCSRGREEVIPHPTGWPGMGFTQARWGTHMLGQLSGMSGCTQEGDGGSSVTHRGLNKYINSLRVRETRFLMLEWATNTERQEIGMDTVELHWKWVYQCEPVVLLLPLRLPSYIWVFTYGCI